MMKKILVLSGSPRKGESYGIVRLIEKRMHQLGNVEFEYIMLGKLNIRFCKGCLSCMSRG